MDQLVLQFIQSLRHHGLPVSTAESLDALKAAALVGVSDRQRLKTALGLTLAKNLTHRGLLDNLFDQFFLAAAGSNERAITTLVTEGADYAIQSPLGRQLHRQQRAALQHALLAAGDAAGVREMQIFLQQHRMVSKILARMGDRELQQELAELQSAGQHLALVAELHQRRQALTEQVKDYVEQQYLLFSHRRGQQLSDDTLHRIQLKNIDHHQRQQMVRLVNRIAKKLASLHSRRRKSYRKGVLDVRKTLAANAAFDGYLYHTRWKSTRIERPRLMIICDVSRSVSQVAQFLLLFVHSLQAVLPSVRSFVFSDRMVEVTNAFKAYDPDTATGLIIDTWGNQSTDYGRALADFSDMALDRIDHKTQIIMLGDGRNNFDDGRIDIWKTVYSRAQRVLWLNPEQRSQWNSGDSMMKDYGAYCSLVEHCSSLRDMERILGRVLKYAR